MDAIQIVAIIISIPFLVLALFLITGRLKIKKSDEEKLGDELNNAFHLSLTREWQLLDEVLVHMYRKKSSGSMSIKQYVEQYHGDEEEALRETRLFIFNQMIDCDLSVRWRVVPLTNTWCESRRYRIQALPDNLKGFYLPVNLVVVQQDKTNLSVGINDDDVEAALSKKTKVELLLIFRFGYVAAMISSRNDPGSGDKDPRYKKPSRKFWWEPVPAT